MKNLMSVEKFLPPEFTPYVKMAAVVTADFANSHTAHTIIFVLRVVAFVSTVLLVGGIMALVVKMNIFAGKARKMKGAYKPYGASQKQKFAKEWAKVLDFIRRDQDNDDRLAVIEADRLFDAALKDLGYSGNTLTERLRNLKTWQLPNLDEVLNAHVVRNRVVHEPSSQVSHYEAETAVKAFEAALKKLGFLG